jgi:hypothetical protein
MIINDKTKQYLHAMLDAALIEIEKRKAMDQVVGGTIDYNDGTGNVTTFGLVVTTNAWTTLLQAELVAVSKAMGQTDEGKGNLKQLTELLVHEPPKGGSGKVN